MTATSSLIFYILYSWAIYSRSSRGLDFFTNQWSHPTQPQEGLRSFHIFTMKIPTLLMSSERYSYVVGHGIFLRVKLNLTWSMFLTIRVLFSLSLSILLLWERLLEGYAYLSTVLIFSPGYFIACPNMACYYKLGICLCIWLSRLGNWDLNFNLTGTLIRLKVSNLARFQKLGKCTVMSQPTNLKLKVIKTG